MAKITFTKFEGDRESKVSEAQIGTETVAFIEVLNSEEFQSPASMRRTMRFEMVHAYSVGKYSDLGLDVEFHTMDGYTRATGVKEAKAAVTRWAKEQGLI